MRNYKERRRSFLVAVDFTDGSTSKIWDRLRKDFQTQKNTNLRGYGLSRFSNRKVNFYRNGLGIVRFPFSTIRSISARFEKILLRALSWLVFDFDSDAGLKYGFDSYSNRIYDKELMQVFLRKYEKYGIGFSHNTFKSFLYLLKLTSHKQLESSLNVFEIGAGVFNFGHLLSLQLESFDYVICDLPEMILTAHKEITEIYIPHCGGDYEVFLPNEVERFYNSDCKRKILFITSKQLHSGVLSEAPRFDLFINHESFGEMDISVVNAYLTMVSKLLKPGAILNIVNRHSRPQAASYDEFCSLKIDRLTNFSDYDLSFCTPNIYQLDELRSRTSPQNHMPNVFFIGEVNK